MRTFSLFAVTLLLSTTFAAASGEHWPLQPLSPRTYAFVSPQGAACNHYFFVDKPRPDQAAFREALRQNIEAAHDRVSKQQALYSVYVYERNAQLNPIFAGDAAALRGVHDNALLAYARWRHGVLDIFWLMEQGEVVFDVLTNKPVIPTFEFD